MNSCQRQEKINIEFLKELVRSGKYDKKQFEDKLRQGETWASAMRYYIQHAHEPKVYTKGRNRSDVYGRDYCNTSIQRLPKEIRDAGGNACGIVCGNGILAEIFEMI